MVGSLPLISIVTFSPLIGALLLTFFPDSDAKRFRRMALFLSLALFVLTCSLIGFAVTWQGDGFILVESAEWIPSLGVSYFVAIDGISFFLILLTAFLLPIVVLSSFNYIQRYEKGYYICLFLLQSFMLGTFVSLDLFLFYIFWEAMLLPMFLLIGIWGGENRIYATVKFFLYTLVGSLLMLVAILGLYFLHQQNTGVYSSNLMDILTLGFPFKTQIWLFLAFAIAFAIKVPMFPFHTWLPDAHVQAPTGGSVVLAGVLLKMGTYGFIRFAIPLFPEAALACSPYIMTLAVIGIIYGALVAWVQEDIKRLVAYSSISHLGFVMLGLFSFSPEAVNGAVFQMVAHGISTGGLFLIVGMLYERRHTRNIEEFGGLAEKMPKFAFLTVLIVLASAGLPGLNGFIGEFMILIGTFSSFQAGGRTFAILSATGVVLAAIYLLHLVQKVLFGPVAEKNRFLSDLSLRELWVLAPLGVAAVVMGVYPRPMLDIINRSSFELLSALGLAY